MYLSVDTTCLSSKVIGGVPIFYNKFIDPNLNKNSILIIEETSTLEIRKIIDKFSPIGVVLSKGSLAGHVAGILDSSSIQLAMCKKLPPLPLGYYIVIDGKKEKIKVYKNKKLANKYININLKSHQIKNKFKQIRYKGEKVFIKIDSKSINEIKNGMKQMVDGMGILRTEWLGYESKNPPTIEDHFNLYQKSINESFPYTLNIRLFDIGGDKIPLWAIKDKKRLESPLGLRGLRAFDDLKLAFENQLQAICKVANKNKVGIVLPMITDVTEIIDFKKKLSSIASSKQLQNISLGSMIETPSSALNVSDIFKECNFVRIGPGDLSQFTLATLRDYITPNYFGTERINNAILKLIQYVTNEGKKVKKEVNMCLDFEPRKRLIKKLLSVGVRTFCVSPTNISTLRTVLWEITN